MMKLVAISFTIFFSLTCSGQTKSRIQTNEEEELLYTAPHFSINVTPYLTQKAILTTQSGNYTPIATNVPGGEGGVNCHLHLNKATTLIIGFHAGAGGRNHRLFIARENFTPHLETDVDASGRFTYVGDFYFAWPLILERRWKLKGGDYWNLNAGLNVRYVADNFFIRSSHYADVSNQMVTVEYFDLMVGNQGYPWLNYNIGAGYTCILKNKNFLHFNILANYSNINVVQGNYTINVTGEAPTVGKYTSTQSFVGLSINYIFTGYTKREKKLRHWEKKGC